MRSGRFFRISTWCVPPLRPQNARVSARSAIWMSLQQAHMRCCALCGCKPQHAACCWICSFTRPLFSLLVSGVDGHIRYHTFHWMHRIRTRWPQCSPRLTMQYSTEKTWSPRSQRTSTSTRLLCGCPYRCSSIARYRTAEPQFASELAGQRIVASLPCELMNAVTVDG